MLLFFLQKYPFIDILPEPLEKWTNLEGNDMLGLIYEDPKRWGLAQVRNSKIQNEVRGLHKCSKSNS